MTLITSPFHFAFVPAEDIKVVLNPVAVPKSQLTLSHIAYEVLFTIWQGGQLAILLKTTFAKVKTILGAVYTLAMLCSIMYALCCKALICSN
jgi:hypothetical protein